MIFSCRSVVLLTFFASLALAQDLDPRLCSVQGDPVAEAPFNLVDAYCIPSSVALGSVGETANVAGMGTFPTNADGQLDVFILWEPGQIDNAEGESFQYSSSLSWGSTQTDAVYKEWVGNFLPEEPYAFLITDSSNPELSPAELNVAASEASVTDRVFDDAAFPPVPLGRYHIQVKGLEPFEDVVFTKNASGGHVSSAVPEPSSGLLVLVGVLGLMSSRARRRAK